MRLKNMVSRLENVRLTLQNPETPLKQCPVRRRNGTRKPLGIRKRLSYGVAQQNERLKVRSIHSFR